jgi:hypothetical protein
MPQNGMHAPPSGIPASISLCVRPAAHCNRVSLGGRVRVPPPEIVRATKTGACSGL